eukprot:m.165709 g.165709  ORF g.165709 m.165709 type:complete len:95 (+) comp16428_c0_seq8:1386-1670(+)
MPEAASSRIWASAFGRHERTKDLVAIVGGPHVCVCDCSLDMRPLLKYTFDSKEDLYSVSWGWQCLATPVPILAVAGKCLMVCGGLNNDVAFSFE